MIPATALDRFLLACQAAVGATEVPPNSNAGPFVERCLRRVGLGPKFPWCAAFLAEMGMTALPEDWPAPLTGRCVELAEWGKQRGILSTEPQVGALGLLMLNVKEGGRTVRRFGHVFVITGPREAEGWPTIEGNTSGGGSREGWGVFARHRPTFGPEDRFLLWWEALRA